MSRAFVKDDDDRPEKPPARTAASDRPNYVTPRGLELLEERLAAARASGDERDADYFEERIASAIVTKAPQKKRGIAGFGSTIVVRDDRGRDLRVTIVGEDEADPAAGKISWYAPYAQALTGKKPGDHAVVHRPAGDATVTIVKVEP